MKKIFCDYCGREIKDESYYLLRVKKIPPFVGGGEVIQKDICDECYREYLVDVPVRRQNGKD